MLAAKPTTSPIEPSPTHSSIQAMRVQLLSLDRVFARRPDTIQIAMMKPKLLYDMLVDWMIVDWRRHLGT